MDLELREAARAVLATRDDEGLIREPIDYEDSTARWRRLRSALAACEAGGKPGVVEVPVKVLREWRCEAHAHICKTPMPPGTKHDDELHVGPDCGILCSEITELLPPADTEPPKELVHQWHRDGVQAANALAIDDRTMFVHGYVAACRASWLRGESTR